MHTNQLEKISRKAGQKNSRFFALLSSRHLLFTTLLSLVLFMGFFGSAEAATFSGTAYESDGVTPWTVLAPTIKVAVATSTSATSTVATFSTTTVSGNFNFNLNIGTIATGSVLTFFVDNNAVGYAVTVTKTNGSDTVSNLSLQKNSIIIKNEGVGTSTKASDLMYYDSTDDPDVLFTASTTLANLNTNGRNLLVASGTTFQLDWPIATKDFKVATTATTIASSSLTVSGDYTNLGTLLTADATSSAWTARSAAGDGLTAVTYGNGLFVAVDNSYGVDKVITSSDGITWTARSAAGDDDSWFGITYGNGLFVAVGGNYVDRVITSPDGINWTARSAAGNDDQWSSITYGNGLFVAVGNSGDRVMRSSDGITWATSSAAGNDDSWQSVTYNNGLFVAVGYGGDDRVMTSPDGITWTARSAVGNNDTWMSVTYGNDLFVAVGSGNGDRVMTSPDGITWTARSAAGNDDSWQSVTYNNGLFVAVGYGGDDRVMTSLDGITWIVRSVTWYNGLWYGITYGNGLFVVVGSGVDNVITSSELPYFAFSGTSPQTLSGNMVATSTLPNLLFTGAGTKTFNNNASTSDIFIATSSGAVTAPTSLSISGNFDNSSTFNAPTNLNFTGPNQTATGTMSGLNNLTIAGTSEKTFNTNITTSNLTVNSTFNPPTEMTVTGNYANNGTSTYAGATWATSSAAGNDDNWNGVTYGNGLFVAVSRFVGDKVITSTDGITWATSSAAGNDDNWNGVTYGNGLFVAVGSGPDRLMTSPDGITWTARSAAGNNDYWGDITYANGLFVAVGYTLGDRVMTSPDGITWTARSAAGNDDHWVSITYGNGLFVALGNNGDRVMTSPDGITWTVRDAAWNGNTWQDVTYGNGLFVAVGNEPSTVRVMTSPDGITWTARSAVGNNDTWMSVTYGNDLFVAVGSGNGDRVMTSPDGITWTARSAAGNDNSWEGVTYGNGLFVAVGDYGDDRVMTSSGWGTTTFAGANAQTLSGNMTGASALGNVVFSGAGTKTFNNNAAVIDFSITSSSSTVVAPSQLTLLGNYQNNGTFTAGSGTTTFSSLSEMQNISGNLTGTSAFNNIEFSGTTTLAATDNLIGYWNFDKANAIWSSPTAATFYDTSGYGNDGVATNMSSATSSITGKIGQGVAFDGTNDYISIPDSDTFTIGTSAITIATWYRLNDAASTSYQFIVSQEHDSFELLKGNNGSLRMEIKYGDNSVVRAQETTPSLIKANQWYHIAGIFTPTTGAFQFYVDGSPRAVTYIDTQASGTIKNSAYPVSIGYRGGGYMNGSADEIRIYKRALSATDIANIYNEKAKLFNDNASTTNFVINSGLVVAPSALTVNGNYANSNSGTYRAGVGTVNFAGNTAQTLSGNMVASSTLAKVNFSGAGTKTFSNNASTSDFIIANSSGAVAAPTTLSISGNFDNSSTFNASTNLYFSGSNQTATGTMSGLNNLTIAGTGEKIFNTDITTNNLTVNSTFVTPTELTITGNYTNNGISSQSGSSDVWIPRSAAGNNDHWGPITYVSELGLFVAVGHLGDNRVMTSPDAVTWTPRSAAGDDDYWQAIAYGNGLLVAVGDNGDRVMTSPDGINWTARSAAGNDDSWYGITYANGLFVAVSQSGDRVMTSPDGTTWTVRSAAGDNDSWRSVIYGNGLFVVVGTGSDRVMTSSDGITWATSSAVGNNDSWYGVTYGNGLFVAVGNTGDKVMTSPDGITWTARNASGDDDSWYGVTYGGGLFVAVGGYAAGKARVMTSHDGISWVSHDSSGNGGNWNGVTYGNKTFVAGGESGDVIMTSYLNYGTTTFSGASAQTVAGNLTGASALGNVALTGAGTKTFNNVASTSDLYVNTTATTTFTETLDVRGGLTAEAGAKLALAQGATTTVSGKLTFSGSSDAPVLLVSETTGQSANLVLLGSSSIKYTKLKDSSACGSVGGEINVASRNNTDDGNISCWNFFAYNPVLSLLDNQQFYVGQATTSLGTLTIIDAGVPVIKATTDIRITIATTTTNFRFNTSTTNLSYTGSASSKVSNTVSYEDGGATLLLNVTSDFAATDTLAIADIMVGSFASVSTTTSNLKLNVDGNSAGSIAEDFMNVRITGKLAVTDHVLGQTSNKFNFQNKTDVTLFAFNLGAVGENATVTDMVIDVSEVEGIEQTSLSDLRLYRDLDSDGVLSGGDTLLDGNGLLTINGQVGALTFSNDFLASSSLAYIVTADVPLVPNGSVMFQLSPSGVYGLGAISLYKPVVVSAISPVRHYRYLSSGGGSSARIGDDAPPGDGDVGGGGEGGGGDVGGGEDGENIAPEVGYFAPTTNGSPDNEWTNGVNGQVSDGVYATSSGLNKKQSYTGFSFAIPETDTIQGIEVKVDYSKGVVGAGNVEIVLSSDNGASYTTAKSLTGVQTSDVVYTLGGPADTWGRSWVPADFASENFVLQIKTRSVSNYFLDGFVVRVYHQAGGGGSGGGGGI